MIKTVSIFSLFASILTGVSAQAYQVGSYRCTKNAGWESYKIAVSEVNVGLELKLPYLIYTSEGIEKKGLAVITTETSSRDKSITESLSLGKESLISFAPDGSPKDSCTLN